MKFEELTDEEWELIEPLLPPPAPTGRPRADGRKTLNGIFYLLTTGCRWMDMPGEYGSYAAGGVLHGGCQVGTPYVHTV